MKDGLVRAVAGIGAGIIISSIGCANTRPYAIGGKNYLNIVKDFKLGKIDEDNSKYQAKGLELSFVGKEGIVQEKYFVAETDLGPAMFKEKKSIIENAYKVMEKDWIVGATFIKSGEGGLFFLERYANWVQLKNRAIIKEPKIIEKKGNLGVFHTTEQDSQFYTAFVEIPGKGHCYIVQVENNEANKKKFYNFYVIPVDGSRRKINQEGKVIMENTDKIFRPKFKCWQQIEEALLKLDISKRKQARKGFEKIGMPLQAEKAGNK